MTRKIKTRTKKLKTRKRNKSKINKYKKNVSNKYFGGEKDGGEKDEADGNSLTTVNDKQGQASKYVDKVVGRLDKAANNVDNLTNSTVEGVNNLADSAEKGATVIGNAASNIGNAALDSADKLTQQTADNYNKLKHSLLKSHDAINKQVHDNEEYKHYRPHNIDVSDENEKIESEEERTERFKNIRGHAIDLKNKHTDLTKKIEGLKQKYENKGDNDLKNSLELENALKLHTEVEELLKNPLIENLIDSSNEQVNEILASGMKMFGNAVTTAGESIPLVGEVVVLENMFRHFLYNMSDGSNAANEIEQKLNQVGNLMSNIGELPDSETNSESPSSPDGESTTELPSGDSNSETTDGETTSELPSGDSNSETTTSSPDGEPVEKKTTSSPDGETSKNITNDIKNTPTTEIPIKTTNINKSMSSPQTLGQDFTKPISPPEENLQGPPALAQGGAMSAMQRRINTSIHDFLQSSILNPW